MKPFVLLLAIVTCSLAVDSFWSQDDTERLANKLQNTLKTKRDNLAALHYSASTLKLLKVEAAAGANQAACDVAKKADLKNLESLFHATALSGDLNNCALSSVAGAKETIDAAAQSTSADQILMALSAANRLAIKVDKAAFDKALTAALKDSSASNLIAVLNAASLLDKPLSAKYFDKIAALVAQADLVNSKFLQYEGGVSSTANAIHGIFSLAALQGKAPAINKDQINHFSNFLMSRKHVSNERDAFHVIRALGSLANNQYIVPVAVSVHGPSITEVGKNIQVHISNLFGLPIAATSVKADIGGKTAVAQNVPLSKTADNLVYDLPLPKVTQAGILTATVTIDTQDKRLVGVSGNLLKIKVVHDIVVEDLKVGVLDKDAAASASNLNGVASFSKLSKSLSADHTKRIFLKFSLKAKSSGKPANVHQSFVVFTHESGAEVIFTADPESQGSGVFSMDLNLAKSHKDFDGLSGKYSVRLVVGDSLMKTPVDWLFADITLTLPAAPIVIVPKSEQVNYEPLKQIDHQFRQPEKRPPAVVSSAFTLICLAPLLLLVIMWLRIGVNFSNMPLSPWVLIFHGGLAALFGLYFVFWLQLDMFETLKYLAMVGSVTFLAGNRLLRALADQRKSKTD